MSNEFYAKDYITGDEFLVYEYIDGWWKTAPDKVDYNKYYPDLYYSKGRQRFPFIIEAIQNLLYSYRSKYLIRLNKQKGTVLDIGCGPGHLLNQFLNNGCICKGIEYSDVAAEIPRNKYKLDVLVGDISKINFEEMKFDIIVSWHTLEHMEDPHVAVKKMVELLNPGGLLYISVPNIGSTEAMISKNNWFHLDVPRHLNHYSDQFMKNLLVTYNTKILDISYLNLEYDTFSTIQSWQNRIGIEHNLLYKSLKNILPKDKKFAFDVIIAYVLAVLFFPVAVLNNIYRAYKRDGAVVSIIAKKI